MDRREPRKKALMLYYDELLDITESLNDAEVGEYLRLVLNYDLYGTAIESDNPTIALLAKHTARTLDRDLEKYKNACGYRQQNRAKQEQQRYGIDGYSRGRFTFSTEEGKERFILKYGSAYPNKDIAWHNLLLEIYTNTNG